MFLPESNPHSNHFLSSISLPELGPRVQIPNLSIKGTELRNLIHHIDQLYGQMSRLQKDLELFLPDVTTRKAINRRMNLHQKAKRKYSLIHKKFVESVLLYSEEVIYWHSVFQQRIVEFLLSSWSNPTLKPSPYDYRAAKFFKDKSEYAKKLLNMVKLPKSQILKLELQVSRAAQKSREAYDRWRSIANDHAPSESASRSASGQIASTQDFLRRYFFFRQHKAYQLARDLEEAKRIVALGRQLSRAQEKIKRI